MFDQFKKTINDKLKKKGLKPFFMDRDDKGNAIASKDNPPESLAVSMIKTIVYAISFAVIFRTFIYDPYHIPSGSMTPTLYSGDKIFVNKFYYGYCASSLPFNIIPFKGRILDFRQPKRGEVVIFAKFDEKKVKSYYIKRLIGIPGDIIEMKNNELTVNGEKSSYKFIKNIKGNDDLNENHFAVNEASENNSQIKYKYNVFKAASEQTSQVQKYVVPKNSYFVMGDNRDNSMDSRYEQEIGFIESDKIIGKAEIIFFSAKGKGRLNFNPAKIRIKRMFKKINMAK